MEERRHEYDPARLLTHAALSFVGALIVFVGIIIAAQIATNGEANTESWAALTGLIGWVTGTASVVFNARFGTTQQSAKKDAVILQQAQTAAAIQSALPTPPIKTDTVQVDAQTAVVTEKDTKP